MSRPDSTLFHVPLYVKASNPDRLIREMIMKNVADSVTHKYFDIQKQGKEWFAWYLGDANRMVRMDTEAALEKGKQK